MEFEHPSSHYATRLCRRPDMHLATRHLPASGFIVSPCPVQALTYAPVLFEKLALPGSTAAALSLMIKHHPEVMGFIVAPLVVGGLMLFVGMRSYRDAHGPIIIARGGATMDK